MKEFFLYIDFVPSFFSILSFPFKWQNNEKSSISTQKNMKILEMLRNKHQLNYLTLKLHSWVLSIYKPVWLKLSLQTLLLKKIKFPCFWLCRHLRPCVCACAHVCIHAHVCMHQPVLGICLNEPPTHVSCLVCWRQTKSPSLTPPGSEIVQRFY